MIKKDFTYTKLRSNRINFTQVETFKHCNDILNVINLIWAFLNNTPFEYKQKPLYIDYTHEGIPFYTKELVDIINKIGDNILGRTTPITVTPILDNSLDNVLMIDNMLDTPSKDYFGALKDIYGMLGTSPFPDGTLITTLEDFYEHIGISLGSPIYIKDFVTNKFIQNGALSNPTSGVVSFQQTAETDEKAIILPDTFNSSTLMFQILNPIAGYIAPYFFRALAANPLMGTGVALGLRIKVVSQANRTFAFDNNNQGTYWGVYGQKNLFLDATASPKELSAEVV